LSTVGVGEVVLEVILNIAFILFSPMPSNKQGEFKEMIVMRFMMTTAAMTTMMAGPVQGLWVWDVLAPCSG
jgi:hypothetical protein